MLSGAGYLLLPLEMRPYRPLETQRSWFSRVQITSSIVSLVTLVWEFFSRIMIFMAETKYIG